jgi:hypothetical protein
LQLSCHKKIYYLKFAPSVYELNRDFGNFQACLTISISGQLVANSLSFK